MAILDMLKGRRTYLLALAGAVAFFLFKIGIMPKELFDWIIGLGGAGALASLRAGVGK